ncbi:MULTISPECIES: hypothetical protein [Methanosarcina]|uniref:Uncharacterized protein n=2 Tax=Methanosarcina barkeri TaxID=2208 RepID=A0A0E3QYC5_METBA|nr:MULTISPECIES: hypothetical protein [Methanosarcina]AKB55854.1 hypothetical protein MSBRM_2856 [Methanosarcina barkeri MS]AKB59330.1 hypothetical protein MSBR2_2814 [Methanosarcina barkeri 227]OED10696.1 hypothetical protein A9239_07045 [Methanosarcina sp. A14]
MNRRFLSTDREENTVYFVFLDLVYIHIKLIKDEVEPEQEGMLTSLFLNFTRMDFLAVKSFVVSLNDFAHQ